MKIKVTQAHIDVGDRMLVNSCPIALAIKEAIGYDVILFDSIVVRCLSYCELTPPEVFDKLCHFDKTGEMEPFEFEIAYES